MATAIATLVGKVLIQIGDNEPVEVGTVEIPVHVTTQAEPVVRHSGQRVYPNGGDQR